MQAPIHLVLVTCSMGFFFAFPRSNGLHYVRIDRSPLNTTTNIQKNQKENYNSVDTSTCLTANQTKYVINATEYSLHHKKLHTSAENIVTSTIKNGVDLPELHKVPNDFVRQLNNPTMSPTKNNLNYSQNIPNVNLLDLPNFDTIFDDTPHENVATTPEKDTKYREQNIPKTDAVSSYPFFISEYLVSSSVGSDKHSQKLSGVFTPLDMPTPSWDPIRIFTIPKQENMATTPKTNTQYNIEFNPILNYHFLLPGDRKDKEDKNKEAAVEYFNSNRSGANIQDYTELPPFFNYEFLIPGYREKEEEDPGVYFNSNHSGKHGNHEQTENWNPVITGTYPIQENITLMPQRFKENYPRSFPSLVRNTRQTRINFQNPFLRGDSEESLATSPNFDLQEDREKIISQKMGGNGFENPGPNALRVHIDTEEGSSKTEERGNQEEVQGQEALIGSKYAGFYPRNNFQGVYHPSGYYNPYASKKLGWVLGGLSRIKQRLLF